MVGVLLVMLLCGAWLMCRGVQTGARGCKGVRGGTGGYEGVLGAARGQAQQLLKQYHVHEVQPGVFESNASPCAPVQPPCTPARRSSI